MADFQTSIPFNFLGTVITDDFENFIPFIDGIIENELVERKKFLEKEKSNLNIIAAKLDLAEKNQLNKNTDIPDIGGINDELPTQNTTERFDGIEGGSEPLKEDQKINPMFRDDGSTADLIYFIKKRFQENIKTRRSTLSYKVCKIRDLIWQIEQELLSLEGVEEAWVNVKTEINRRSSLDEYWEVRKQVDASTEKFVQIIDENGEQKGPQI